ncbi:MAG: hypothetical protein HY826_02100 [Actinobacteria bacterium]|nr:hypothetical protein [Actinomycetota bacterium]
MKYQHVVVWIDHRRATVMHMSLLAPAVAESDAHDLAGEGAEAVLVKSQSPARRVHLKAGVRGDGRVPADLPFFDDVARAIAAAQEILVVGPGAAKNEFVHHLQRRHQTLAKRVVAVETVDHPSERELLAFARRAFNRIEALRG